MFSERDFVTLVGLRARSDMNGLTGEIVKLPSPAESSARYGVSLRGLPGVMVKMENLRLVPPRHVPLPDHLWLKVLKDLPGRDVLAFASTCKQLRGVQVASERVLVTKVKERDLEYASVKLSEECLM